jgi:hypothetical protein
MTDRGAGLAKAWSGAFMQCGREPGACSLSWSSTPSIPGRHLKNGPIPLWPLSTPDSRTVEVVECERRVGTSCWWQLWLC